MFETIRIPMGAVAEAYREAIRGDGQFDTFHRTLCDWAGQDLPEEANLKRLTRWYDFVRKQGYRVRYLEMKRRPGNYGFLMSIIEETCEYDMSLD